MQKDPAVSVITVNYNQLPVTLELLASIRNYLKCQAEVIVVDNGSKEDPTGSIQAAYPGVQVLRSEKNLGFAGGNNLGIRASRGAFLFFVNNDAEITENCVELLLEAFQKIPRLGMVSPLICHYPSGGQREPLIQYAGATPVHPFTARNRLIGAGDPDRGQFDRLQPTAYVHGAAMLVRREAIERAGEMPERFFLYYEELDWSEQIRRAGFEIYLEPRARVYHKESFTVGSDSPIKTYYLNRNRILFVRRNRSFPQRLLFFLFLVAFTIPKNTLVYLAGGKWDHLRAFYRGIWWNVVNRKEETGRKT